MKVTIELEGESDSVGNELKLITNSFGMYSQLKEIESLVRRKLKFEKVTREEMALLRAIRDLIEID